MLSAARLWWGPAYPSVSLPRWAGGLLAVLLGLGLAAACFGIAIIPPWRTGWMLEGRIGPDPVQYWLGWTYFRDAPWSWPPGLNPDWGMEIGSSLFYADAIPLLAFAFKALRPLADVAQYWGLWIFACLGLQALLAWRLVGLFTGDALARLAGIAFFIVQPILLARLGGHFALGGQFLLLGALYLCLTEGGARRGLAWAAMLGGAALVHAYLLPMVAGLWVADWLARAIRPRRASGVLAVEALAVPALGVACLWAEGFFALRAGFGGTWGGYGAMQLDLLALFNPGDWGRFLPSLPHAEHLEGQDAYPGLGALLLLGAGAGAFLWRPLWGLGAPGLRRRWPLLAMLALMLGFAITHRITIGGQVVAVLPLPEAVIGLADALRASVRFLWPVLYAGLIGAIAALVHAVGGRRAGLALAVLALVQVVDMGPGFARLKHFFRHTPAQVELRLADPFWRQATARYDRLRLTPTDMQARHWEEVAVLAATQGLPTDAVYLARLDPFRVAALNAATLERLAAGRPEPGSLYILGDDAALAAARAGMDPARDRLLRADGLWVLAPGWHRTTISARAGITAPAGTARSRTGPAEIRASAPPTD